MTIQNVWIFQVRPFFKATKQELNGARFEEGIYPENSHMFCICHNILINRLCIWVLF